MTIKKEKLSLAILLLVAVILCSNTNLYSQLNWSQPVTSPCHQGFEARAAFIKYSNSVNQYEWIGEVKNNYNRLVHFNMTWVIGNEKKSIGRFSLQPGRSTNAVSHYFNSSATNWLITVENVCFGENWMSCAGNCYADCDIRPGVPNQPSENDCKGLKQSATTPPASYPATTKNNTTIQGNADNRGLYGTPTQTNQSQVMNLLQNQDFVNGVSNALDDLFEAIRQRKEEKKKLKEAKNADKIKNEAMEAIYSPNETATYLHFITDYLEKNNNYNFKKLSNYTIRDNHKYVKLLFEEAELDIQYFYFPPVYGGEGTFNRNVSLKFQNKTLLDVFLQSETFKMLSKYSKPNDASAAAYLTYSFNDIDFKNSKEFRDFSKLQKDDAISGNIFKLMDSVTQRTEGPIDPGRNLGEVLKERGDAYLQGNGIKNDNQIAIIYYQKAAQLGNLDAMYTLHIIYKFIEELKDAGMSAFWLEQACQRTYSSSFYCAEYEKLIGQKYQPPVTEKIVFPQAYSLWKQSDSSKTRILFYNAGDSIFTTRPGIPGYGAYKRTSPGVYLHSRNTANQVDYVIRSMNDTVIMKLVYGKDSSYPIQFDYLVLESTNVNEPDPAATDQTISVEELTGEWYAENQKSVKFTISLGNDNMLQGKFSGMNTESYKKVSSNKYEFENPNYGVTLLILDKSKLAVKIYYKKAGFYSSGLYSR